MWETGEGFSICYVTKEASVTSVREVRYNNRSFNSKITEISLSLHPFKIFIRISNLQEWENLQGIFRKEKLPLDIFGKTELCFSVFNHEQLNAFFKAIEQFQPDVSQLQIEFIRKYNKDYTDYSLAQAPPALACNSQNFIENNTCSENAEQRTKRPLEQQTLRRSERIKSRME